MGRVFKTYLHVPEVYACCECLTHIVDVDGVVSKQFVGHHGKAYLFENVVNITLGPTEERSLLTGMHEVADFFCNGCDTTLGWKYEVAQEASQKYKEGKYIVEKAMIRKVQYDKLPPIL
ncbi:Protein yippee-like [Diplonema papillatum]|nr:Protein yippee-like [Diplonema papillatum]